MKKLIALALATCTAVVLGMATPRGGDHEAVERACFDYIDAFYEVKPEYIERSVHESLRKVGFSMWGDMTDYSEPHEMTFAQARDLAASWNTEGTKTDDDSPREVVLYEVLDKTAVAKVTATWGVDYMHLAKFDDTWKIINVIWQSHPPRAEASYAR